MNDSNWNSVTYEHYLASVRGILRSRFGIAATARDEQKATADYLGGRSPHQCAMAIARTLGLQPSV
jgi:hypothetical protein